MARPLVVSTLLLTAVASTSLTIAAVLMVQRYCLPGARRRRGTNSYHLPLLNVRGRARSEMVPGSIHFSHNKVKFGYMSQNPVYQNI